MNRKVYITRFAVTDGISYLDCEIVQERFAVHEKTTYNDTEVIQSRQQYNPGDWFYSLEEAKAKAHQMIEQEREYLKQQDERLMRKSEGDIKKLDEDYACIGTTNLREHRDNHLNFTMVEIAEEAKRMFGKTGNLTIEEDYQVRESLRNKHFSHLLRHAK